jgi:hypothetical protein
MEAHDRAVDQRLCRRGPSNATITSEALMTALAGRESPRQILIAVPNNESPSGRSHHSTVVRIRHNVVHGVMDALNKR